MKGKIPSLVTHTMQYRGIACVLCSDNDEGSLIVIKLIIIW
ncbi:MAG: hypothetical protein ACERKZ_16155 [Lachnotalea sp.]